MAFGYRLRIVNLEREAETQAKLAGIKSAATELFSRKLIRYVGGTAFTGTYMNGYHSLAKKNREGDHIHFEYCVNYESKGASGKRKATVTPLTIDAAVHINSVTMVEGGIARVEGAVTSECRIDLNLLKSVGLAPQAILMNEIITINYWFNADLLNRRTLNEIGFANLIDCIIREIYNVKFIVESAAAKAKKTDRIPGAIAPRERYQAGKAGTITIPLGIEEK